MNNTLVAIDGSKFKAVNNRDKNFTRAKMKPRLAEVESSVDCYLEQLTEVDATEATEATEATDDSSVTFKFGDNEPLCNELLRLIRLGDKTATCEALSAF